MMKIMINFRLSIPDKSVKYLLITNGELADLRCKGRTLT